MYFVLLVLSFGFNDFALGWGSKPPEGNQKTFCGGQSSPVEWSYCVSPGTSRDVLYYFHGKGATAIQWEEQYGNVRNRWQETGAKTPTVVAISFGGIWLLAEPNFSLFSGKYNAIVETILPFLEKEILSKLGSGVGGRRIVVGESMGGFNASQMLLKTSKTFDKVALLCPAIPELSPFADPVTISNYASESRANLFNVIEMLFLARMFFPDPWSWESASPFSLAQTKLGPDSPELFLSCGNQDEYGFFQSTERFAYLAKSKGVKKVEWYPVDGKGHCAFDAERFADFIVR